MGYSHSVVERILPSGIEAWRPLLVIGNRKSGGANTDLVLNSFRTYLNSVQVRDSIRSNFYLNCVSLFRLLTFQLLHQHLFLNGVIRFQILVFIFLYVVVMEQ